jgi:hypothetical protein
MILLGKPKEIDLPPNTREVFICAPAYGALVVLSSAFNTAGMRTPRACVEYDRLPVANRCQ